AFSRAVPLFALLLALLLLGVIVGGVAAWLRQGKWRRAARLAQGEARELRVELDRLRRQAAERETAAAAPRLTLAPPAAEGTAGYRPDFRKVSSTRAACGTRGA